MSSNRSEIEIFALEGFYFAQIYPTMSLTQAQIFHQKSLMDSL